MNNYVHEIKAVKDRQIKYFLMNDYFHDSIIKKIDIIEECKNLIINLSCVGEWPNYNIPQYCDDLNYEYQLEFKECIYFETEKDGESRYTEYLNGRFKNSSKLNEIIKRTKKNYYHFRIQISTGYFDIIFKKFNIKKSIGEIKIPNRISLEYHFDFIKSKFYGKDVNEIKSIFECEDDIFKSYALEYLWLTNYSEIESFIEKLLYDDDTEISAIFILGEIGTLKHLKQLNKISENENRSTVFKRHIKDAVEKIISRI